MQEVAFMHSHELNNFGHLFTGKAPPQLIMKVVGTVSLELGSRQTPLFFAKLPAKDRYWKRRRIRTFAERGISNKDFIETRRSGLMFYTTLVETCGQEQGAHIHEKITLDSGVSVWRRFFPKARDFLRCPDPQLALREYVLEFLRAWAREGVVRFEVQEQTDTDLRVRISDCSHCAVFEEAGYPEISRNYCNAASSVVLTDLANRVGCTFKREACICLGAPVCDWHFCQSTSLD
jgi:hypothetical protein